jgi:hypothetical protein
MTPVLADATEAEEPWRALERLAEKMGAGRVQRRASRPSAVGFSGPSRVAEQLFYSLVRHPVQPVRGVRAGFYVAVVDQVSHGLVVLALVRVDARPLRHLERLYFAGRLAMELLPGPCAAAAWRFHPLTITRARRDPEQATRPAAP